MEKVSRIPEAKRNEESIEKIDCAYSRFTIAALDLSFEGVAMPAFEEVKELVNKKKAEKAKLAKEAREQ